MLQFRSPVALNSVGSMILGLIGVVIVAVLIPWALGGNETWQSIRDFMAVALASGGAVLVGVGLFGRLGTIQIAAFACSCVVLLTWHTAGVRFMTGTVHIDNFSWQKLSLSLDGNHWRTVPSRESTLARLVNGSYELVVAGEDGSELDRRNIQVEGRAVYVLNLLRMSDYFVGSVEYGNLPFLKPDNHIDIVSDVWFETDADYLFQDPPEEVEVELPRGSPGLAFERRTFLRRVGR